MFRKIAYVHAISVAFVRAVNSVNLIVQIKRRRGMERRDLMGQVLIHWMLLLLLVLILIGCEFIVPEIRILVLAIKLIIIRITLINVQFRDIDVYAEKSAQAGNTKKSETSQ